MRGLQFLVENEDVAVFLVNNFSRVCKCRELTEKPKLSNVMRYHFYYMEFSLNLILFILQKSKQGLTS